METTMIRLTALPLALVIGVSASAQESSLDEMMGQAMEATAPTKEHDLLRRLAGEWTYVVEMTVPGTPPMRGSGMTSIREILGGRFMEFRSTSDAMDPPVQSVSILGYDSRKGIEEYFALSVDTLGHYYIDPRGKWDPESASLVLHGEEFDPATGMNSPYRQVFRFPGEDTMTCEVFITMPGAREPYRMVGIVYRRVQGRQVVDPPMNPLNIANRSRESFDEDMELPSYTAGDIESMDRKQLQRAMIGIMRARTMDGVMDATRADLDDQYKHVLDRLRSMPPRDDPNALGTAPGDDVEIRSLPAFTDEIIAGMDEQECRAALVQIASSRRDARLDDDERAELKELFSKVFDRMKELQQPHGGKPRGVGEAKGGSG